MFCNRASNFPDGIATTGIGGRNPEIVFLSAFKYDCEKYFDDAFGRMFSPTDGGVDGSKNGPQTFVVSSDPSHRFGHVAITQTVKQPAATRAIGSSGFRTVINGEDLTNTHDDKDRDCWRIGTDKQAVSGFFAHGTSIEFMQFRHAKKHGLHAANLNIGQYCRFDKLASVGCGGDGFRFNTGWDTPLIMGDIAAFRCFNGLHIVHPPVSMIAVNHLSGDHNSNSLMEVGNGNYKQSLIQIANWKCELDHSVQQTIFRFNGAGMVDLGSGTALMVNYNPAYTDALIENDNWKVRLGVAQWRYTGLNFDNVVAYRKSRAPKLELTVKDLDRTGLDFWESYPKD